MSEEAVDIVEEPTVEEAPAPEEANANDDAGDAGSPFEIPEAYREKGWVKNVKSVDDLFKIHDDAQALIGKKAVIPDLENGADDEVNAYLEQITPKDAAAYDAVFGEGVDENMKGALADVLKESNISVAQAKKLLPAYAKLEETVRDEMFSEESFFDTMRESFGESYKEPAAKTASFIAGTLNDSDKALIEEMPNKFLGVLYRMANKVMTDYGAEEGGAGSHVKESTGNPVDVEKNRAALREELRNLSNRPHTVEEKAALIDKLKQSY